VSVVGSVGPGTGVSKPGAAAVSIVSNSVLIALKLAAAAITGSVAILSEALHSMIDLVASVIAFVSVRKADEPADVEHPYGHEKVENVAATIEGMLIIVGAGVIVYEAVHRLAVGASVENLGVGIAVIGFSALANLAVSRFLSRQARRHDSPALSGDAAHLGTDALTSFGVLLGLLLVKITGADAIDSVVALMVAVLIVAAGIRILRRSAAVLVDEAPPPEEMDRIEEAIARARADQPEVVGYHKLRARTTGRRVYVDLHVQFRGGTSLERAHEVAHQLRDAIESDLGNAEVLIHVEPESSRRDPAESPKEFRAG
jgi:cation diffusion facilitator family transporter